MSGLLVATGRTNPKTLRHSLAGTTAATFTFGTDVNADGVNTVVITASVDTEITAKWGAAAPTTDGTNSVPVDGYSFWVGPSYGPAVVAGEWKALTLGVYNLGASTSVLHAFGYFAPVG